MTLRRNADPQAAATAHAASCAAAVWPLTVIYVVWGTNFAAVAVAVRDMNPLAVAGLRFTLAGAALSILGVRLERRPPTLADWRSSAEIGVLLFVGASGLLFWGLQSVSSGVGAVLIATVPFWLVGFDLAARRTPPRPSTVLVLAGGFTGVAIIANPGAGLDARPAGVAAILTAAALWALGSLRARDLHPTSGPTTSTGLQMLCGGALLNLVVALATVTGRTTVGTPTREGLLALIWLTGPCAMLGFAAYGRALREASTLAVAIYPFINTIVAITVGWALLHEPVTVRIGAGTALIGTAALPLLVRPQRALP